MWSSTVCDKDIIERRQDINNLTKNVSKIELVNRKILLGISILLITLSIFVYITIENISIYAYRATFNQITTDLL